MFAQTLAPLTIGAAFAFGARNAKFGWISLGLGGAAIAALLTLFAHGPGYAFYGALQKTFQLAADVWVLISALVVLDSLKTGRSAQTYAADVYRFQR